MANVIKAVAFANGTPCPHHGHYLETADFEAHGGLGHMTFTADPAEALRFATPGDAIAFWQRRSVTFPLRADGRPNRPLTALTVEIERAPPALEES